MLFVEIPITASFLARDELLPWRVYSADTQLCQEGEQAARKLVSNIILNSLTQEFLRGDLDSY